MEGIDLAIHLRTCILASARMICEAVTEERGQPCATCISNVEMMHAEFLGALGIILKQQAVAHQAALPSRPTPLRIV